MIDANGVAVARHGGAWIRRGCENRGDGGDRDHDDARRQHGALESPMRNGRNGYGQPGMMMISGAAPRFDLPDAGCDVLASGAWGAGAFRIAPTFPNELKLNGLRDARALNKVGESRFPRTPQR